MNLSLSKVKIAAFASRETTCYEAVLNLDGKPVAEMHNDGNGGCDFVHWSDKEAEKKIEAYFASLPQVSLGSFADTPEIFVPQDLELWVSSELERLEQAKLWKRRLKQKVYGVHDGAAYSFKLKPEDLTAERRAALEKKYPGIVILNGIPEAEFNAAIAGVP